MSLEELIKPTKTKRFLFFLLMDIIIISISLFLSYLVRFDFDLQYIIGIGYFEKIKYWLPIFILIKISLFYINKLYFVSWRFISIEEFFRITISLITSLILIAGLNYYFFFYHADLNMPRSIPMIDFFICLFFISILRISKRFYNEKLKRDKGVFKDKKALVIGAGNTGSRIVRELLRSKNLEYFPIGFLDDDPHKQKIYIHNIQVLGKLDNLENILKEENVDMLIIAIPSLPHTKIKDIYQTAKKYGVKSIKIVPSIENLPEDLISVKDLRDINLEDLLKREPVTIDMDIVSSFLNDKVVLITGAAGSIGSEIVRQTVKFSPKKVIAFEIDETELFYLEGSIRQLLKKLNKEIEIDFIVGDVRDYDKLERVFKKNNIDVVFHAAAYKHVPLMEHYPEEAVKANIFGTYNLAKLSVKYGVGKFVNISTDKAVNPTSIMGATKRMAEMICMAFNSYGITKFVSVRFGNVLGSRGSVIPVFLEQIKNGGPITVTHPEVKRYFMTIPEAVLLVFQAAAMANGGEVFVLDMGEPVKIVELAEELIRLNGLEPYKDIDIVFTGLRPGEKLFEELLTAEEGTISTKHSKVYIAKISSNLSLETIEKVVAELESIIKSGNVELIKKKLEEIIPFYKHKN